MYNDVYSQYLSPEAMYTPEELYFLNQGNMSFPQQSGLLDTQGFRPDLDPAVMSQFGGSSYTGTPPMAEADASGEPNMALIKMAMSLMGGGQAKDDLKDPGVRMGQLRQFNFLGGPGPRQASFNPMAY